MNDPTGGGDHVGLHDLVVAYQVNVDNVVVERGKIAGLGPRTRHRLIVISQPRGGGGGDGGLVINDFIEAVLDEEHGGGGDGADGLGRLHHFIVGDAVIERRI